MLEEQEIQNIVDLVKSKDIDNVKLGFLLIKGLKKEIDFEEIKIAWIRNSIKFFLNEDTITFISFQNMLKKLKKLVGDFEINEDNSISVEKIVVKDSSKFFLNTFPFKIKIIKSLLLFTKNSIPYELEQDIFTKIELIEGRIVLEDIKSVEINFQVGKELKEIRIVSGKFLRELSIDCENDLKANSLLINCESIEKINISKNISFNYINISNNLNLNYLSLKGDVLSLCVPKKIEYLSLNICQRFLVLLLDNYKMFKNVDFDKTEMVENFLKEFERNFETDNKYFELRFHLFTSFIKLNFLPKVKGSVKICKENVSNIFLESEKDFIKIDDNEVLINFNK